MRRLATAVVGVLALGACDVEFIEPVAREPAPVVLSARFDYQEGAPWPLDFSAYLRSGVDAGGTARPIVDDTLRLSGHALTPHGTTWDSARLYTARWAGADELDLESLRMEPPGVNALAEAPGAIRFAVSRRVGPDTLLVAPQDTVTLALDHGPPLSEPALATTWLLQLVTADGFELSRWGSDDPPAQVRVPASWLEWTAGAPIRATVLVQRAWTREAADGDYQVRLAVRSMVGWTLVWDAEPAP